MLLSLSQLSQLLLLMLMMLMMVMTDHPHGRYLHCDWGPIQKQGQMAPQEVAIRPWPVKKFLEK